MKGYPKGFLASLLAVLSAVVLTGLLLAPTTLGLRFEIDVPWRLPGSARILTAAVHALASFAVMALVGALWSVHMRSGWRRRRHRASGTLLGSMMLLLTATAIGVYYIGDDSLAAAAAAAHLGLGLALLLPFGWHWLHGRRSRRHKAAQAMSAVAAGWHTAAHTAAEAGAAARPRPTVPPSAPGRL